MLIEKFTINELVSEKRLSSLVKWLISSSISIIFILPASSSESLRASPNISLSANKNSINSINKQ